MAEKIQVEYDLLGKLASQINSKAEEIGTMNSKIVSQTEVLARSWTGRSAEAFQGEMEELVLPALKRLHESLTTTSTTIEQLRTHWQSVEQEAKALFPSD